MNRAPVLRDCNAPRGRCAHPADAPQHHYGTISWAEHVEAWEAYALRAGRDQTAERLAQRGGFSYSELVQHLGHAPTTWVADADPSDLRPRQDPQPPRETIPTPKGQV